MWKANKHTITSLTLGFLLAVIIVYSGFINTLLALFLVGAIPGTNMNIDPTIMLIGFATIALCVLFQTSSKSLRRTTTKKRRQMQRVARKRVMPKRHYSRV